eukprot:4697592-Amphidinium_carterae.1
MLIKSWMGVIRSGLLSDADLWHAVAHAVTVLSGAQWPWRVIHGPTCALLVTLARLQWECLTPQLLVTHTGIQLDLRVHGASFVTKLVASASRVWADCEALSTRTSPPQALCWPPIHAAIKAATTPLQAYAIAATVSGAQWTSATLAERGATKSDACTLCGCTGDQLHRLLFCEGWSTLRKQHVPAAALQWAAELRIDGAADVAHLRVPKSIMQRGLPTQPLREQLMNVHWSPCPGPFSGVVFTDGSAASPAHKHLRVASWAVVQMEGLDSLRTASALLPIEVMPDQTVVAAELHA